MTNVINFTKQQISLDVKNFNDPNMNPDARLRRTFLQLWNSAVESPTYDSEKWNEFRDLLLNKGINL